MIPAYRKKSGCGLDARGKREEKEGNSESRIGGAECLPQERRVQGGGKEKITTKQERGKEGLAKTRAHARKPEKKVKCGVLGRGTEGNVTMSRQQENNWGR